MEIYRSRKHKKNTQKNTYTEEHTYMKKTYTVIVMKKNYAFRKINNNNTKKTKYLHTSII